MRFDRARVDDRAGSESIPGELPRFTFAVECLRASEASALRLSAAKGDVPNLRLDLLGSVVTTAWPLAPRSQQTGKLPIIGYLAPNVESVDRPRVAAFAF